MAKETVTFRDYGDKSITAGDVASLFSEWDGLRETQLSLWEEIDRYVHSTDNSDFSDHFNHSTFIPVVSEIHDDLQSIMYGTVFPHNDWLGWQPMDQGALDTEKRKKVLSYLKHIHTLNGLRETMRKVLDDYTRYGNCFVQVVYENRSQETESGEVIPDYSGPSLRRISPYDIVFNPTATSFENTPKIIRELKSIGGFMSWVQGLQARGVQVDEEAIERVRNPNRSSTGVATSVEHKNAQYIPAGMNSIESYYNSGYVEILWFYGSVYDKETQEVTPNRLITVVDGSCVLFDVEQVSSRVFKGTWKPRPDNLWGQGALDNIIGINYMINHRENGKSESLDRMIYPDRLYAGEVEEIYDENTDQMKYLTTEGGSVQDIAPDASVLSYQSEIEQYEARARRAARLPQQLSGFRTPGEKTAQEVQTLNDGAFRGFINRAEQFEQDVLEKVVKAEIMLARDNYGGAIPVPSQDEDRLYEFVQVTKDDLNTNARLVPYGARRFARLLQQQAGLQQLAAGGLAEIVRQHMDTWKTAEAVNHVFGFEEFEMFDKFASISEEVERTQLVQQAQQEVAMSTEQPTQEEFAMNRTAQEDSDGV